MKNQLKIILLILLLFSAAFAGFFIVFYWHKSLAQETANNMVNTAPPAPALTTAPVYSPERVVHQSADFTIDLSKAPVIQAETEPISALVVQHHLVAKDLINHNFATAADNFAGRQKNVKTIVIMSPNHFLAPHQIFTSDGDWETQFGRVFCQKDLVDKVVQTQFGEIDYQAMEKEHGIFNLIPFVKFYFPQAQVVPLVISESVDATEAKFLAQFLADNLPEDSLVILSADFSHYLPQSVADFHDQASISGLYNVDESFSRQMDIDNPSSLLVLYQYLKLKNSQRFVLLDNSNSQNFFTGHLEQTTSYVSGYYTSGPESAQTKVNLLAVGDVMLDRSVYSLALKNNDFGWPFSLLKLFLKGVDWRLANLEGPVTDFKSVANTTSRLTFTFSPSFLPSLQNYFEVVDLANNHTLNFGQTGLAQTRSYLTQSKIDYFGDPQNSQTKLSQVIEKDGVKIGLVGYHGLVKTDFKNILAEVKKIKKESDFIIVYSHWGSEYVKYASSSQQKQAHELIDAGTDLVLGSHPHVVEPIENYQGKYIFYSLGNFVFDQYFSLATSQGLTVGIVLDKNNGQVSSHYYLFPVAISKTSQTGLMDWPSRQEFLKNLSNSSQGSASLKASIVSGYLE